MEKNLMSYVQTIRYMGNKNKLLKNIVPLIYDNYSRGSCVCDLMAGTNTVAYALRKDYRIITNDSELFSKVISEALICNNKKSTFNETFQKLKVQYEQNLLSGFFTFFKDNYTDKYFSGHQCFQIDSIRYAIEKIGIDKSIQLTALMYAMNVAQSTPGHFAQYLPSNHPRVQKLREINIFERFTEKLIELYSLSEPPFKNESNNIDYKDLLKTPSLIKPIDVFYVDPPYTAEQYSRFYHLLNTLVKYDHPELSHKAGYRVDRFKSNFSYKTRALNEFEELITNIYKLKKDIILSYSSRGLVSIEDIKKIFEKTYKDYKVKEFKFVHSKLGKGNLGVNEILFYAKIAR
jgi:adenine-specific DNA-methyltransferase